MIARFLAAVALLVAAPLGAQTLGPAPGAPAGTYVGDTEAQTLAAGRRADAQAIILLQQTLPIATTYIGTAGSSTFTPNAATKFILVDLLGGGGGGGGSGGQYKTDGTTACAGPNNGTPSNCVANGTAGGTGGSTSFGSVITVTGGQGGALGGVNGSGNGGAGGAVSGTPSVTPYEARNGQAGGPGPNIYFSYQASGKGGGALGGLSIVSRGTTAAGGLGAGGGGGTSVGSGTAAGSGGEGGSASILITTPAASYTVTVGAGGTGGAAGTNGDAGGAGAPGMIRIREYAR